MTSQQGLIDRFTQLLRPGGLLMLGHSENLSSSAELYIKKGHNTYERNSVAQ